MPTNAPTGSEKGEQATIGLESDLKTLQQLTSSAEAAKKRRDDSKHERAERKLHEAIEAMAQKADRKMSKANEIYSVT
ncbi:hypothetical protein N7448_009890 [Penicillium atrosanguineum]|uniref:Uncharacterized protein n=1 Tax=Penicillium atrosanguineum TaxID=1132637 RepID=A0A9W9PYW2_9EURO|nr:hypothetical protein N7448_009890 [Penicillium atrosanguineum]KAJ5142418.1 hypothetical protein N7526_003413 [Penicillium atrosanguineum]KAJ5320716.1 hypothetical protein N7476_003718 [Penicillium atrosanguineum]